jgi:2-alkenal reductase
MGNRGVIAGLAALLLVGMMCVCLLAPLYFWAGGDIRSVAPVTGQSQVDVSIEEAPPLVREPEVEAAPPVIEEAASRPPVEIPSDLVAVLRAEEEVLAALYESVSPSVVSISVSGESGSVLGELGEGSGFVWDEQGHIVTNNHVVESARTVIVNFFDGTQTTAEVVGTDPDSDLAVLRAQAMPEALRPVTVGSSADLRVGQRVIAIGNPFGFNQTLTVGVVSAVQRTVPGRISAQGGSFRLTNLVQTDAAINPGNSGGPLLDIEGRVVGVNTLIFSRTPAANSGVGFAVPVDKVKAVVPSLIADGRYETPYLGISAFSFSLTQGLAEALGLREVDRGILVQSVEPRSPAAQAGVRGGQEQITLPGFAQPVTTGGDVIVAINDRPVREFDDLINYLDTRSVGDVVTLRIIRGGQEIEIPVTLGARP